MQWVWHYLAFDGGQCCARRRIRRPLVFNLYVGTQTGMCSLTRPAISSQGVFTRLTPEAARLLGIVLVPEGLPSRSRSLWHAGSLRDSCAHDY